MNESGHPASSGRVASVHLHPSEPGAPLRSVDSMELIAGKGAAGDARYFGRTSRSSGEPSRRHITLIAREEIAEHAAALGLQTIPPGAVRANIETLGINLLAFLGRHVAIGGAVLHFYEARTPCAKMDAFCLGLRDLMKNERQGVLAEVIQSGLIRVGDSISPVIGYDHEDEDARAG
ncbi:MAG TPA: MOSC domain-containing protein [Candidatus Cybelea sp.]|nr:MOSC domain-containing protein [Candidatus Cybelea sp.]